MSKSRRFEAYYVFHFMTPAKGVQRIKVLGSDHKKLVELLLPVNNVRFVIRNFKLSLKLYLRAKEKIRLLCWSYIDNPRQTPHEQSFTRSLVFKAKKEV